MYVPYMLHTKQISNKAEPCDFCTFHHSYTGLTRVLKNRKPSVGIMKSNRSREPKTIALAEAQSRKRKKFRLLENSWLYFRKMKPLLAGH